MEDPTASWDPLEELSEEDYYSEADKKLIKEQQSSFKKFFSKLISPINKK